VSGECHKERETLQTGLVSAYASRLTTQKTEANQAYFHEIASDSLSHITKRIKPKANPQISGLNQILWFLLYLKSSDVNATPMKNEITIGGVSFQCIVPNDQINFQSKPCKYHSKSNPRYGLFAELITIG
jgi:hypothetical protein